MRGVVHVQASTVPSQQYVYDETLLEHTPLWHTSLVGVAALTRIQIGALCMALSPVPVIECHSAE